MIHCLFIKTIHKLRETETINLSFSFFTVYTYINIFIQFIDVYISISFLVVRETLFKYNLSIILFIYKNNTKAYIPKETKIDTYTLYLCNY